MDVYVHPERQRRRSGGMTAKVYTQNTERKRRKERKRGKRQTKHSHPVRFATDPLQWATVLQENFDLQIETCIAGTQRYNARRKTLSQNCLMPWVKSLEYKTDVSHRQEIAEGISVIHLQPRSAFSTHVYPSSIQFAHSHFGVFGVSFSMIIILLNKKCLVVGHSRNWRKCTSIKAQLKGPFLDFSKLLFSLALLCSSTTHSGLFAQPLFCLWLPVTAVCEHFAPRDTFYFKTNSKDPAQDLCFW